MTAHPTSALDAATVADLREKLAKATPGPWHYESTIYKHMAAGIRGDGPIAQIWSGKRAIPNAALIVAAVNALPLLLAELDALREAAGSGAGEALAAAEADAARYRYLREYRSDHWPMTHEQPAEWSIGWEFQQRTPEEAYGSIDHWIDQDIAWQAAQDAENHDPDLPPSPSEAVRR